MISSLLIVDKWPSLFSTKVSDIFYNYTFTFNRTILSGIIKGWRELLDQGYKLSAQDYLRPALKHINALGGGILLDVYSEEEIREIMIDYVKNLYRVKMKLLARNKNDAVSNWIKSFIESECYEEISNNFSNLIDGDIKELEVEIMRLI